MRYYILIAVCCNILFMHVDKKILFNIYCEEMNIFYHCILSYNLVKFVNACSLNLNVKSESTLNALNLIINKS